MSVSKTADPALARGWVYAALSRAFLYPTASLVGELTAGDFRNGLTRALMLVGDASFREDVRDLMKRLTEAVPVIEQYYQDLFTGQTVLVPNYETEYTASSLWHQTQQMADIAGFYRAFGVDSAETGERPDSVSSELEFMYLLCVKEAIAVEEENAEAVAVCAEARQRFLTDHLGAWLPRFAQRLEQRGGEGYYTALARLTARFVALERS